MQKNQPAADTKYLSKGLILMQRDYTYLRKQYPDIISCEQLTKICHISKCKAKWLLENSVIPCVDTGKQTWRFRISIDSVIDYLIKRDANSLTITIPVGIFSSKSSKQIRNARDSRVLQEYVKRLWHNKPDVLTIEESSNISDYSKFIIYSWIKKID